MTRIKFLAGLIAGGIIVAAIIAIFVMKGSTELTSEDFTEIKDNVVGTDPTTIEKFSTKQTSKTITLSITANGTIPFDGRKLPVSEPANEFGYAWLSLTRADHFSHLPDRFEGFIISIKPGDDGSNREKWWNIKQVILLQTESDWCVFSSQDIQGEISVEENELSVIMNLNKESSHIPLDRSMVVEIIDKENCSPNKSVQFLDTKLK